MKNTIKWLGIIVLMAVIGFSMVACSNDNGDDPVSFVGNWSGTATISGEAAPASLSVTSTGWTFICPAANMTEIGTYSGTGNLVTLVQDGITFGTATLSGTTLTVVIVGGAYAGGIGTFTK